MATQTIPAATITICDACGCRCDKTLGAGRRVQEGRLIVRQHALDMLGSPAACGDVEMDLCDTCLARINGAIHCELTKLRASTVDLTKPPPGPPNPPRPAKRNEVA